MNLSLEALRFSYLAVSFDESGLYPGGGMEVLMIGMIDDCRSEMR